MRWLGILALLVAAFPFWAASFLALPYDSWGDPPHLRPSVAQLSSNLALIAILLLCGAAALGFWRAEHRRGWQAMLLAATLFFFMATALARVIWIEFHVLS